MKNTLIEPSVVRAAMEQFDVTDLNNGSIRQIGGIVKTIEERTGEEFVHLEMGVPGLPPEKVGIAAEHAALDAGVASIYPEMPGIPELKYESSRFLEGIRRCGYFAGRVPAHRRFHAGCVCGFHALFAK